MWLLPTRTIFVSNPLRDISLLIVLAILTWGCSGPADEPVRVYEGPNLPAAEISIVSRDNWYIRRWWMGRNDSSLTVVLKVDGVTGQRHSSGYFSQQYHVLPGEHQALVSIGRGEGSDMYWNLIPDLHRTVSFSTQAGKHYDVFARRINDVSCCPLSIKLLNLWVWVEEDGTGEVVGGEKHPDD